MGNTVSSPSGQSPIYDRQTFPRSEKRSVVPKAHTLERSDNRNQNNGNQENSRMLFLMYLINRTWNVVVDGKGSKRWVNQRFIAPEVACDFAPKNETENEEAPKRREMFGIWHHFHFHFNLNSFRLCSSFLCFAFRFWFSSSFVFCKCFSDDETNKTRFLDVEAKRHDDNYSCVYGSECSYCSCGYCEDEVCRINGDYSICERLVKILTAFKISKTESFRKAPRKLWKHNRKSFLHLFA